MRCATCGERLAATDERCPVCGVAVGSRPSPFSTLRFNSVFSPHAGVRRCPRCHYTGDGIAYFRRPGHGALLVGASLLTYGVGGVVYWLLRRHHTVCPSCGFLWDDVGRLPESSGSGAQAGVLGPAHAEPLPSAGGMRRAFGGVLLAIAALAAVIGISGSIADALTATAVFGTAGTGMFWWGWKSLQDRRAALAQSLERRVLQLATLSGGTLTVTDVATKLDISMPAAERVLHGMDDGFRVTSDVTDEGILLFQFPEVQLRRLDPPDSANDPRSAME